MVTISFKAFTGGRLHPSYGSVILSMVNNDWPYGIYPKLPNEYSIESKPITFI